ncbi:9128_t:CDS:2 [Funneliformis geosporum]|nr:9128_t:CDS:2 [Funneliformis geosporum]
MTSGQKQQEAHAKKDQAQKDKIFEEQVNNNPRYGSPGEDTQERRDRFKEYETASETQKENLQTEENTPGDETVGTESDNNFSGQFSFTDSLTAINKLKNIGQMIPPGMEQGMSSNKPY